MTLKPVDAERLLTARLGEPAKVPTKYVVGFRTRVCKVLAIHRSNGATQVWFQPPAPPHMDGVTVLDKANNGNSNLNGPLLPLKEPGTLRVQIDTPTAMSRFLDWYDGAA